MKSLHNLIRTLEAASPMISGLDLTRDMPNAPLQGAFLNLAGRADHQKLMVDGLQALTSAGLDMPDVRNQAKVLLSENGHYGAFCEVGTYGWLANNGIEFVPQVALGPKDVLNPNGCTIDGRFKASEVYFDIKAMGFTEYTRELFLEKVHVALPGIVVTIEGPSDVAVKDVEQFALRKVGSIAASLANGPVEVRELNWKLTPRPKGGISPEGRHLDVNFGKQPLSNRQRKPALPVQDGTTVRETPPLHFDLFLGFALQQRASYRLRRQHLDHPSRPLPEGFPAIGARDADRRQPLRRPGSAGNERRQSI